MKKQYFNLLGEMETIKNASAVTVDSIGRGYNFNLRQKVLKEVYKGNKVRVFDVTGEFTDLVNQLGGRTIALDEALSNGGFDDELLVSFSVGKLIALDLEENQPQVFVLS